MLSWKNKKDNKKRYKFMQDEKKRLILKFCLKRNLKTTRVQLSMRNYKLKGKLTIIQNRCLMSSNSRSVYRQYKLSRMFLKNYAHQGLLPGLIKYNW